MIPIYLMFPNNIKYNYTGDNLKSMPSKQNYSTKTMSRVGSIVIDAVNKKEIMEILKSNLKLLIRKLNIVVSALG